MVERQTRKVKVQTASATCAEQKNDTVPFFGYVRPTRAPTREAYTRQPVKLEVADSTPAAAPIWRRSSVVERHVKTASWTCAGRHLPNRLLRRAPTGEAYILVHVGLQNRRVGSTPIHPRQISWGWFRLTAGNNRLADLRAAAALNL